MTTPITKIYGASDDLLEIEGPIITEELNPGYDEKSILGLSDGTLLEIEYDSDGIWRIRVLSKGSCDVRINPGSVSEDRPDVAVIEGEFRWALLAVRGQYNPVMSRR